MGDSDVPYIIDTSTPHPARVYDAFLGGKDNYEADRQVATQVVELFPDIPLIARQNRAFLRRAVQYLAGQAGIDQFLDIGSGLPTADNTHEVAQKISPQAKVLYADNDPIVLVHGRALLAENGNTRVVTADLAQAEDLLAQVEQTGLLDLTRPAALMLIAVLHFIPEDADALVASYLERLAPGSALVISHVTSDDTDPDRLRQGVRAYSATPSGIHPRTGPDITRLFDGTALLSPGVVPVASWRPEPTDESRPTAPIVLGGIGLL